MKHAIAHLLNPSTLLKAILVAACSISVAGLVQAAEEDVQVAALSTDDKATPARTIPVPQANIASTIDVDIDTPVLEEVDNAIVKDKLTQLLNDTKTATWNTKVCEYLGDKSEEQTVQVAWAGLELQRVRVLTGRAAGKTLLLRGDTVHVGWLRFSHTNRMVQTLRGNSLKLNGFMDDIQHMLNDWDNVLITDEAGQWLIDYTASNGIKAKLWMDPNTMQADKIVQFDEAGQLSGTYEYDSIVFNPKLPASTWKKRR